MGYAWSQEKAGRWEEKQMEWMQVLRTNASNLVVINIFSGLLATSIRLTRHYFIHDGSVDMCNYLGIIAAFTFCAPCRRHQRSIWRRTARTKSAYRPFRHKPNTLDRDRM